MGSNGRYNKIISIKKMWSSKERCGFGFHDLLFFSFWISLSVRNYFFFVLLLVVLPLISQKSHIFFFVGRKKRPRDRTFLTFCNTHTHTHTLKKKLQNSNPQRLIVSIILVYIYTTPLSSL